MKTALITGAAKRIGQSIALHLSQEGWDVAIHYHHSQREAEMLAEKIQNAGRKAITIKADLSNESEVREIIPTVNAKLAPITCLVNNASHFRNDTLLTSSRSSWDAHMETNLRAPMVLMQEFARQLPKGTGGNIINILDYCVLSLPNRKFLSYAVSRSGLFSLTQMLAVELAPSIRVNAIGPGPALANDRQTAENFAHAWEASPLKRTTSPEEICRTVSFILSMPSLTGQMIALDGGRHLEHAEYL